MDHVSIADAVLFGIVQGLTEFLPVSSSGHLTIFHQFLGGMEDNVFFDVALHCGTLCATVLFFARRIGTIMTEAGRDLAARRNGSGLRRAGFILLAVVPTGIIGVVFKDPLEAAFTRPDLASLMLLVTGTVLAVTAFIKTGTRTMERTGIMRSLLIGTVQGIAIIPGISRSGSTICTGLFSGMDRKEAGEYSFLISLPAIAGALLLKLGDVPSLARVSWTAVGTGFIISFIVGLGALALLMKFVRSGRMWVFAPYCLAVGIAGLIYF